MLTVSEARARLANRGIHMSSQRLRFLIADGRIAATRDTTRATAPWMLTEEAVDAFQPMRPGRPRKWPGTSDAT